MATLASAILDCARKITDVLTSVTTGAGTVTTLVDAAIPRNAFPNDHFNKGILWFLSGALIGKTTSPSDFDTGGTWTFPTQTAAPGNGSRYAAADRDFPLDILKAATNQALQVIHEIPQLDATLTTVADQESYTLPSGVYNVLLLQVANSTSAPYEFIDYPLPPERNGLLYFDKANYFRSSGYTMRLWYLATPAELTADADTISQYINPQWLAAQAAAEAMRWRVEIFGDDKPSRVRHWGDMISLAARMRADWEDRLPDLPPKTRISTWGQYARRGDLTWRVP